MPQIDIRVCLREQLALLESDYSYDIAWENSAFEPSSTPYIRYAIMFSEMPSLGMPSESIDFYTGILQVDVVFPVGLGMSTAETMISNVMDEFDKGTVITYGDAKVIVQSSYYTQQIRDSDDSWMYFPINIIFKSFT